MLKLLIPFAILAFSACSLVDVNSEFGLLSKGEAAKRQLIKDVEYSEQLRQWFDKQHIDYKKMCAQKVAYFNDTQSDVVLELHGVPCNKGKLLESPLMTARWKYIVDEKSRFQSSKFLIGDKVVGVSAGHSDDLLALCSDANTYQCEFYKDKSKEQIRLK